MNRFQSFIAVLACAVVACGSDESAGAPVARPDEPGAASAGSGASEQAPPQSIEEQCAQILQCGASALVGVCDFRDDLCHRLTLDECVQYCTVIAGPEDTCGDSWASCQLPKDISEHYCVQRRALGEPVDDPEALTIAAMGCSLVIPDYDVDCTAFGPNPLDIGQTSSHLELEDPSQCTLAFEGIADAEARCKCCEFDVRWGTWACPTTDLDERGCTLFGEWMCPAM